ncbi:MAG: DUF1329 domain-containing protein [Verrucomicrobia bacterium]|nr:DUF1329 domain-containing protein [Verrucomicrobiota bacterium]
MKTVSKILILLTAAATLGSPSSFGKVSQTEANKLGKELTPLGAEQAGNADLSIPAWEGGITEAPAGYSPGMHHPDPFSGDRPLYTITANNMNQYSGKLTEGHKALLNAYPETYKLPVFQSRRSASNPKSIYDNSIKNATKGELIQDGNGIKGTAIGVPFPIPQNGLEVVWNHLTRYRGKSAARYTAQVSPTRSGSYTLVNIDDQFLFNYNTPGQTEDNLENVLIYYKQKVVAPARLAGSLLVVHETIDQVKEPRRTWTYNVGQRRVRRAPNVAYDNPGTASDGLRTSDQLDMYNGAPDRYDWKLVGKAEYIIPYNSYTLHSDNIKIKDIISPRHINQDLARYELHRCWVVEATLKEGTRHIYSKRTFYIDEDSWQIMVADQYDGRGELWRVSEGHSINYYDELTFWTTLELHMDLFSGRYNAGGLDNEMKMYDFAAEISQSDFSAQSLRREGLR